MNWRDLALYLVSLVWAAVAGFTHEAYAALLAFYFLALSYDETVREILRVHRKRMTEFPGGRHDV